MQYPLKKQNTSYLQKCKFFICFILFFIAAIFPVLWLQLDFLHNMPGDIGDPRLNNYYLENIYLYLTGHAPSLLDLQFFYPFPDMLGLGDNLFGSAPVYVLARFFTDQSESAYQIWYLFGYFFNYLAAYYALRCLNLNVFAAIIGALIFSFALPVNAQANHPQLHYRFGIPLSVSALILFLEQKNWRYLLICFGWFVWQFYCSIYTAFFLFMLLGVTYISCLLTCLIYKRTTLHCFHLKFIYNFKSLSNKQKFKLFSGFVILSFLFLCICYPYVLANKLYHPAHLLYKVANLLPKLKSYLFTEISTLWKSQSDFFSNARFVPEGQLFFGAIPLFLVFLGYIYGFRSKKNTAVFLMGFALPILIILTLSFFNGWLSLWYLFAKLPIASGIRTITRIYVVLLFPVAFLSAVAVENFFNPKRYIKTICLFLIAISLIYEFSSIHMVVSPKNEWIARFQNANALVPNNLPEKPILFFAQKELPVIYNDEIDAIWVSLKRGIPTLNGYTAFMPKFLSKEYGNDCTEIPRRILAYLFFINQIDNSEYYLQLMRRVVPIGFEGCQQKWWDKIPKYEIVTTNQDCMETFEIILKKTNLTQNSEKAKIYLKTLQLLNKYGIEKCPVNFFMKIY